MTQHDRIWISWLSREWERDCDDESAWERETEKTRYWPMCGGVMVAIGGSVPFVSPRAPIHHRTSNQARSPARVSIYSSQYIYLCIYIHTYVYIYGSRSTECIWFYGWLLSPGAPSPSFAHAYNYALLSPSVHIYRSTYEPHNTGGQPGSRVPGVPIHQRPSARSTGGPNWGPLISSRGNPQPVTVFTHMWTIMSAPAI